MGDVFSMKSFITKRSKLKIRHLITFLITYLYRGPRTKNHVPSDDDEDYSINMTDGLEVDALINTITEDQAAVPSTETGYIVTGAADGNVFVQPGQFVSK